MVMGFANFRHHIVPQSLGEESARVYLQCFFGEGSARKIPNGLILLFGMFLRGRMYPKWFVFLIWDAFLIRIVSQSCYFKDLGCF